MSKGISGHQSANMRTDEWLTPLELIEALGPFDLDPCAPVTRPWSTAANHYTIYDNGLLLPWYGRVWLNPPYGKELIHWMGKMSLHREGISLIFARTDTQAFHRYIFNSADSILFIEGRLSFYTTAGTKASGNGGAPSVLIAYGEQNVDALADSKIKGRHVLLNAATMVVVEVNHTWKSLVTIAMTRISQEASLQQIYDAVERIAPDRVSANKHYKEKIRQTLQLHFNRMRRGTYTINT